MAARESVYLRMATVEDAKELVEIYAPYVENTAISFEYETPSVREFAGRIAEVLERFPYLAAMHGEEIVGYAYAHPYGVRKAYSHSVELSVYIRRDCRGMGIGRMLYEAMERLLKEQNITNLYVLVAGVGAEDEYLTHDSQKFHLAMGYDYVGKLHKAGYKFGRWYDMITMEKIIADHPEYTQPDVVPWYELSEELFEKAGVKSCGLKHSG